MVSTQSDIIIISALLVAVLSIVLVLFILNQKRKGRLQETPNEHHFSQKEYQAGQGYVDHNPRKIGRTKTLKSFSSHGFISWEDYFHPTSEEHMFKRRIARRVIIVTYFLIMGLIVIFALIDMIGGMLFLIALMLYLTILILLKFLTIKVFHKSKHKEN